MVCLPLCYLDRSIWNVRLRLILVVPEPLLLYTSNSLEVVLLSASLRNRDFENPLPVSTPPAPPLSSPMTSRLGLVQNPPSLLPPATPSPWFELSPVPLLLDLAQALTKKIEAIATMSRFVLYYFMVVGVVPFSADSDSQSPT